MSLIRPPRLRLSAYAAGLVPAALVVMLTLAASTPAKNPRCGHPGVICEARSATPASSPTATEQATTTPTDWRRTASFEQDLDTGTDGWNLPPMPQASGFTITRTDEVGGATGSNAAKIVSSGGNPGCSCPRMKFEDGFRYTAGRDVWLRGSWYFPDPASLTWSRMMNLSSYTGDTATDYYTGLVIEDASGEMLVRSRNYQSAMDQKVIFPARPIPVGRWFTVTLHFKLSPADGEALNEWYVDGELVGTNTVANMQNPQAINVFQAGMPYWLNGVETTVYFDDPALKD
jgi:hypothetical protein